MHLVELNCAEFRGLRELRFMPQDGINVISGCNGQGKTSLLEALLFLATSRSHRTSQESDLACHGTGQFRVGCRVRRKDRDVLVEASWWRGAKRFKVNGLAQERVSDILGAINVVFFSPEDVSLVRGSAAQRRRFLDMALAQLSPAYLRALQQYRVVIRQRNEILRRSSGDPSLLDVWDEQLVGHGTVLMRERGSFVERLAEPALGAYDRIAQGEKLVVRYRPDMREEAAFGEVLRGCRAADVRQGITTRGPHRDDIEFLIEGRSARQFASQGQQRSVALALKLGERELVQQETGEGPILMLDDVLSELDAERARRLMSLLEGAGQCLLTTVDSPDGRAILGANCAHFVIRRGMLGPI